MADEDDSAFDPSTVIAAISAFLLGETPTLRRAEVEALSGIPAEVTRERWRALGFPEVDDETVAFTHTDVEALRITQKLIDLGILAEDSELAFIRTTGRMYARLAEWQARNMLSSITGDGTEEGLTLDRLDEIIPLAEQVQAYVWRRHLAGAATRLLLRDSTDTEGGTMCVGFADIVGYTSQSRKLTTGELAAMVERFEGVATSRIVDHGGQVIKTIGDEILFVTDRPIDAARLALELLDEHLNDEDFPQVRIGMAYGSVLNRLGDVFGPVVNVSSRLTSIARPGRAVVDRALAEQLRDDEQLRVRRMRRVSVKGYPHLEPWSLKRPRDDDDPRPSVRDAIEEVLEDASTQVDEAARAAKSAVEKAADRPRHQRSGKDRRPKPEKG
ncbi:MAG: adenylate/guanylate cyclase domain-containing protein [Aeromicrobium sp.]